MVYTEQKGTCNHRLMTWEICAKLNGAIQLPTSMPTHKLAARFSINEAARLMFAERAASKGKIFQISGDVRKGLLKVPPSTKVGDDKF